MHVTNYFSVKMSLVFLSFTLLISACGGGKHIIPLQKGLKGNTKVSSINITTNAAIKSTKIAARVKQAIVLRAKKSLNGAKAVKLNVMLNSWYPAYDLNGNQTINKKTRLTGIVSVLDNSSGTLLGKYTISSVHLGNQKEFAGVNVNTKTIDSFAYFVTYELE